MFFFNVVKKRTSEPTVASLLKGLGLLPQTLHVRLPSL
jgi:hypothetical protein